MKKLICTLFTTCLMCSSAWAQDILTVVYAVSDDGFVSVRARPTVKARELTKLYMLDHALGHGVLRGKSGKWSKVSIGKVTGWAYSNYVGTQNWYKGTGKTKLVAASAQTPIYRESHKDGSKNIFFAYVNKGTILADEYSTEGEYYVLTTAHDNLYIRKKDARIVTK